MFLFKAHLEYSALFIPIWWSWVGTTFYADRFDSDDVIHRVLVFIQMYTVGTMAIFVLNGFGEGSAGFALSYTANRVILIIMYRTFAHAFTPPLNPLPIAWRGDFKMRFSPLLQYLERGPGGEVSESPDVYPCMATCSRSTGAYFPLCHWFLGCRRAMVHLRLYSFPCPIYPLGCGDVH